MTDISSYLLTPPRSFEQVIAELTRNQANNFSMYQRDIAPDADQNAKRTYLPRPDRPSASTSQVTGNFSGIRTVSLRRRRHRHCRATS